MAMGELAQEDPQGRRRVDATEDPFHPARTDHVQVVDAISPGQQPGQDRGDLPDRVRRPGCDALVDEPDLFLEQFGQAGLLGQRQHRDQPARRHQVLLVELPQARTPGMQQSH